MKITMQESVNRSDRRVQQDGSRLPVTILVMAILTLLGVSAAHAQAPGYDTYSVTGTLTSGGTVSGSFYNDPTTTSYAIGSSDITFTPPSGTVLFTPTDSAHGPSDELSLSNSAGGLAAITFDDSLPTSTVGQSDSFDTNMNDSGAYLNQHFVFFSGGSATLTNIYTAPAPAPEVPSAVSFAMLFALGIPLFFFAKKRSSRNSSHLA
jgi:hypothetical protein